MAHSRSTQAFLALLFILAPVLAEVNTPFPPIESTLVPPKFSVSLFTSVYGTDYFPYLSDATDSTRTRTHTSTDASFVAQTTNAGNHPTSTATTGTTTSPGTSTPTPAADNGNAATSLRTSGKDMMGGAGVLATALAFGLLCFVGGAVL